ncbi:sodium-independent sulfate anion transporter-like isoform X1 [Varroa jacobsoni]|uniref:sodium-independent sulfate anion transporter-like isoform X1 n=1 Tax=Varroa jacobsoni TaxID=62625 RepID=UPI000BF36D19|nr:sodium-independent sulfate anion transporter-like isoform X1 [Varroa jacobsoni]
MISLCSYRRLALIVFTEDVNSNGSAPSGCADINRVESETTADFCGKLCCAGTGPQRLLDRLPIVSWLPKYSLEDLYGDAVAGTTVALTVIPQGLALAGVANLSPQYGLYTAFMGSFIYILFGSAKDLTIGPTAIMCIMTGQYTKFGGATYAVLLTVLSGCLQLVLGLLNLGFIMDFISGAVISAFTSAGALTIAATQLKGLTGIKIDAEHFFEAIYQLVARCTGISWADTSLGVGCMIVLLTMRYFRTAQLSEGTFGLSKTLLRAINVTWWAIVTTRNVIVVLLCGALTALLEAQGKRPFALTGKVHGGLPPFKIPDFSYTYFDSKTNTTETKHFGEIVAELNVGIFVIGLLSILESIAIAKTFAKGKRINATQEMFALGCCNVAGSFVSAFPATGSFSRTAINNMSGVRTPMGGFFTGAIVLAALAFMSPYFYFIPKATLASIIITSVVFMVHVEDVSVMWKTSKTDLIPFAFTFFGSFIFGLEYGIMMGVVMAILLLLYHNARPTVTVAHVKAYGSSSYVLCRIDRSVLFPSALYATGKIGRRLRESVYGTEQEQTLVVIDGSHLPRIDYTTCMALRSLKDELAKDGTALAFTALNSSVSKAVSAALGENFRYFSSYKEIEDFAGNLGVTKVGAPEDI